MNGHPSPFKTPPATLAVARRMIELNATVAAIALATGMGNTTICRLRDEMGRTQKAFHIPPMKAKAGMAITPRGVADDFLALPRPIGATACGCFLQAHVGLAVHQLRPVAPVARVHRIPDLDALLDAHNAAGSAGVDLSP